jgi:acyl-CoA synthetase (AMP-forming)/AMP-acid ligase II
MPAVFPDKQEEVIRRGANLIGKPSPLLASRLADVNDDASFVDAAATGELVYRSPVMMAGYYRDEEATKRVFRNGWFHSGDLGSGDPDGYRFIVGRVKEMIKTGGENVSSPRVEAVLAKHPSVAQAAVIGMPDETWGEAVVGVIVATAGAEPSETEIIAFCRGILAGYETPKRIIVLDELPMDFLGKVRKYALREKLLAAAAQQKPLSSRRTV